jgi:hypothetical protein
VPRRSGIFLGRLSWMAGVMTLSLALLCAHSLSGPGAEARRADNIPPTFSGLESAVTCVPGPIGGGRTTSYTLSWNRATDNATPAKKIIYDVYQAETSGGEDFATPTYTTSSGATTFATPPLPTDKQFFFVVRARDQAGNSDANTVEREGQNFCL